MENLGVEADSVTSQVHYFDSQTRKTSVSALESSFRGSLCRKSNQPTLAARQYLFFLPKEWGSDGRSVSKRLSFSGPKIISADL